MGQIKNIRWMIYIFNLLFSFQVVLMPGAMAAGHMGDTVESVSVLSQQNVMEAKVSAFVTAEPKILSQNTGPNTSKDWSCFAIDCSCTFFLGLTSAPIQIQQSGIKKTFYLIHLAEPPTLVLPAPPRTI